MPPWLSASLIGAVALSLAFCSPSATSTPTARTPDDADSASEPAAAQQQGDPESAPESDAVEPVDASRLVVLGGGTTEIVAALGQADNIVAADASSRYPAEVADRATLGIYRRISAEGVIASAPTAVLASEGSGPPTALEQIRSAGIEVVEVPGAESVDEALARIETVGTMLGASDQAARVNASIRQELDAVAKAVEGRTRPRVLFVYARGGGTMMVAGQGTSVQALVQAAGGTLAAGEHEGFAPLTAEAVVAARPDVILLTDGGMEAMGGVEGVLAAPGVSATPAGSDRRVLALDDLLLLSFGPRTGQAVRTLASALHPDLSL